MLLVAAVLALVVPAGASAGPPRGFVGLQGWEQLTPADLNQLGRANVRVWRANLNWAAIERERGSYDWSNYDRRFNQAAAAGVRIMPVLVGSPRWIASKPQWPPRTRSQRTAFRRFTEAAVRRYGPNGRFWQGKPYSTWTRAWWWQVWNEPNHRSWWTNRRPNASEYASMLIEQSTAAKRVDPSVKIVTAGLPQLTLTTRCAQLCITKFLTEVLRVRGAGRALDAVAVHTYSRYTGDVVTRLRYARDVMNKFSDTRRKHLWITELGWSTNGYHAHFPAVSRSVQASKLRESYRLLLDVRSRYRLAGAVWFSHRDPYRSNDWQRNTGLFDWRGGAKPAWRALIEVTGGQD